METNELKKKALELLQGSDFNCSLSAYGGGACGDGWDGDDVLYLNRAQLLYLIFNATEVNGEKTEVVNIEDRLETMAYEGAWPDGEPDDEEEDISDYSYSGESDELNHYLEGWRIILNKIDNGEIDENDLDSWLEYFKDSSNWDDDITWWKSMQDK